MGPEFEALTSVAEENWLAVAAAVVVAAAEDSADSC